MRVAALALLCAAGAAAQVFVMARPEPMLVTNAIPVRVVGMWDLHVCNDGPTPARVPAEKVFIALREIPLISASSARVVLTNRRSQNKKAVAAMLIRYGLTIGTSVTAFGPVAASRTVVGALAFAGVMAAQTERQLQDGVPSIEPFTSNLLDGALELEPGDCQTRTAFAAKVKRARPVYVRVDQ